MYTIKYFFLRFVMAPIRYCPYLGTKARENAKKVHYSTIQIPFSVQHAQPQFQCIFLTDLHIGGNIDTLASSIHDELLSKTQASSHLQTIFLHGGDFCSSNGSKVKQGFKHFCEIFDAMLGDTTQNPHFGVIGNHDRENRNFGDIRSWLEKKYGMHFFEKPTDSIRLGKGEKQVTIMGIHTLSRRFHLMRKAKRNHLMDAHIDAINSTIEGINIVLLHNPDGLEYLLRRLRDTKRQITSPTIFLAGHTHGAMFDGFPLLRHLNLLLCHTLFGRYKGWYGPSGVRSRGFEYTGNWRLYVSNGVGNSPGFDMRLGSSPEIVFFEI